MIALLAALASSGIARAAELTTGSVTGLPTPRYVSLKTDRVNLREGPSKDHRTTWIFQRAGLPVEIVAEFETWRRIRDAEGAEGWVLHSLLSGRRTALVAPWAKTEPHPIHEEQRPDARVTAKLQSGVIVNVKGCANGWCRVVGDKFDGHIPQKKLWGVYPEEKLN